MAVRRPVARLRTASSSSSWSFVGDWTSSAKPANATMPICVVEPCRWMKDDAASSAACKRVGWMSVEHMLPETSMARMIVVWPAGTLTIVTGRERATARLASPTTNRANGRCRRRREEPGCAVRTSDRLE